MKKEKRKELNTPKLETTSNGMNKNIKIYKIIGIFILVFSLFSFTKKAFAEFWQYDPIGEDPVTICGYVDGGVYESKDGTMKTAEVVCNEKVKEKYPKSQYTIPCRKVSNLENKCVLTTNNPIVVDAKEDKNSSSGTYTLLAPIGQLKEIKTDDIGKYFNTIFLIAIGLAGALAVIMIIIAGVQWMGTDSVFGKTEAKKQITGAVLGLLIALGAFALLNTIDPALLGTKGLTVDQVNIEIVDLPDAGGGDIIDPDYAKGEYKYYTDDSVSPGVSSALVKLKNGWKISAFRVYPSNNRMVISLIKGSEVDNSNIIDISPGGSGYSEIGKGKTKDNKTPKGNWKILEIRKSKDNKPVFNKNGVNMGATFWLLNPTTIGERGIGMHGNKRGTLGETAGCLRLKNSDLLALLPYVKVGIPVNILD